MDLLPPRSKLLTLLGVQKLALLLLRFEKSSVGDPFSVPPSRPRRQSATKIDARGIVRPETELSSIRGGNRMDRGTGMLEMRNVRLTRSARMCRMRDASFKYRYSFQM